LLNMKSVARLKHFTYKAFNADMFEQQVSEKHNNSLKFLKQHFLSHAVQNFVNKAPVETRTLVLGRGFSKRSVQCIK
jgi:hypothetical protein